MQRLLTTGKEASIRGSSTAHLVPPPLQKTELSEEVSLLTVKVSVVKLCHRVLSILGFMCPQLTWSLLSMLSLLMQSQLQSQLLQTRRRSPRPLPRQVQRGRLSRPPSLIWTWRLGWMYRVLTRPSSRQLQRRSRLLTMRDPADEEL